MKVLLIGASGFIGSQVTRALAARDHAVTVVHRGQSESLLPDSAERVHADRNRLHEHAELLRRLAPDVVIDCILSSGKQAKALMDLFRGTAGRVVALSSGDVYRAAGILHGFEVGPLQAMPLTEEAELRTKENVYGPEALARLRSVFPWLDEEYDKIPVERAILGDAQLPGTVVRLPMVYGPNDPLHRLFPYVKRMDDGRPAILVQEDAASWRGPRGYVEDVAEAIVLAAVSDQAAGRIYNVAEAPASSEEEWILRIASVTGWKGRLVRMPGDEIPAHLRVPGNLAQHWEMSSRRIREELHFHEPVSSEAGLAKTIEWERNNPPSFGPQQFDYAAEDEALAAVAR